MDLVADKPVNLANQGKYKNKRKGRQDLVFTKDPDNILHDVKYQCLLGKSDLMHNDTGLLMGSVRKERDTIVHDRYKYGKDLTGVNGNRKKMFIENVTFMKAYNGVGST